MKSVFGLSENMAAAFSYLLGPLSGLLVLVLERENKFVRFHALQSTIWFLFMWIIRWGIGFIQSLLGVIPLIGTPIAWIFGFVMAPVMLIWGLGLFGSKIFLMLKALSGSQFKLPFVGEVAWNQINK